MIDAARSKSDPAGREAVHRDPAAHPPRTPRWVKVSGIVALALVGLFVILHVTGLAPPMQHGLQ